MYERLPLPIITKLSADAQLSTHGRALSRTRTKPDAPGVPGTRWHILSSFRTSPVAYHRRNLASRIRGSKRRVVSLSASRGPDSPSSKYTASILSSALVEIVVSGVELLRHQSPLKVRGGAHSPDLLCTRYTCAMISSCGTSSRPISATARLAVARQSATRSSNESARTRAATGHPPKHARRPETRGSTQIINERLRELNLSARAAERRGGLKRDTIRNILRGCSPTYRNLVKVCDALDLTITIARRDRKPVNGDQPGDRPALRPRPEEDRRAAVYNTFRESETSDEVIAVLRGESTDIIGQVMDEMVRAHKEEEADELGEMAAQAGHKIW